MLSHTIQYNSNLKVFLNLVLLQGKSKTDGTHVPKDEVLNSIFYKSWIEYLLSSWEALQI